MAILAERCLVDGPDASEKDGAYQNGPPFRRGVPLLGVIPEYVIKGNLRLQTEAWRELGDIVGFRLGLGLGCAYLFVHPEHVKRILIDNGTNYLRGRSWDKLRRLMGNGLAMSDGASWQQRRRPLNKYMTRDTALAQTPVMADIISQALEPLRARGTCLVDIQQLLAGLILPILTRAMLGVEKDLGDPFALREAVEYCIAHGIRRGGNPFTLPLAIPTPGNLRFQQHRRALDRFVDEVIISLRARPVLKDDLFTALVAACGNDEGQIHDEILNLIVGGYETSILSTTWAVCFLSMYPGVQERVQKEVDEVLQTRRPGPEEAARLTYVRQVFKETLRLRPPVPFSARDAEADDIVGPCRIRKGDLVVVAPVLTHQHPSFWPNPLAFDPERFSPEGVRRQHPHAYFPFLTGGHTCIGMHIALLGTVLILATLAQHYDLHLEPGYDLQPELRGYLRPRHRQRVRLVPRRSRPRGVVAGPGARVVQA